jgi:hypothetical protein
MVEQKRKNQKRNVKANQPSKWLDMRVIIPSIIVSFIFSISIYLYMDHSLMMNSLWVYLSAIYGFGFFVEPEGVELVASKIVFFTVDFVIVFLISYVVFWFVVREEDKRLYKKYKKEGLIK